jgi:hypothetical protein
VVNLEPDDAEEVALLPSAAGFDVDEIPDGFPNFGVFGQQQRPIGSQRDPPSGQLSERAVAMYVA